MVGLILMPRDADDGDEGVLVAWIDGAWPRDLSTSCIPHDTHNEA